MPFFPNRFADFVCQNLLYTKLKSVQKLRILIHYSRDQDPEVIYLKHVEREKQQQRREEEVSRYGPPTFMTPLNDLTIMEGEKAHLDAKVGPVGDPSIKVEWYCNGQTITASKVLIQTLNLVAIVAKVSLSKDLQFLHCTLF